MAKEKKRSSRKEKRKQQIPEGKKVWLFAGLIAIWAFLIYSNIYSNSAQFDDSFWMSLDELRDISDLGAIFSINPFRFIPFFTFALNFSIHGYDLAGYYFFNVLIHTLNGLILFYLIRTIFKTPAIKDLPIAGHSLMIAFFAAMIFVSHPLQTQAVTYIYQRITSIASLFYISAAAFYIRARIAGEKNIRIRFFAMSVLSIIFAFFSKESTFSIPLMLILAEFAFFQKKLNFKAKQIIFAAVFIAIGLALFYAFDFDRKVLRTYTTYTGETINNWNYFVTQFDVFLTYIRLLFLPLSQNVDYYFPVSESIFSAGSLAGLAVVLGVITSGILLFKKNRLLSFGIFWIFIALIVESSFIPIMDVIMEHRLYLPMAGFSLFLVAGIYKLLWERSRQAVTALSVLIIVFFTVLTYQRNEVWSTPMTFWTDVIEKSPQKARPYNGRGLAYFEKDELSEALSDFNKAIVINPELASAYQNRGNTYMKMSKFESALADFNKAIELNPENPSNYNNRGNAYLKLGKYQKAIKDFKKFIEFHPDFTSAYFNIGDAYLNLGKLEKADEYFSAIIALGSPDADMYYSIGKRFYEHRFYERAIKYYDAALKADPRSLKAYLAKGTSYYYLEDYQKAIENYDKAINLSPGNISAHKYKAMAYEKSGNYEKAIEAYSDAVRYAPADYMLWYMRGNNKLALGRFKGAAEDYRKTLELKPDFRLAKERLLIALSKQ